MFGASMYDGSTATQWASAPPSRLCGLFMAILAARASESLLFFQRKPFSICKQPPPSTELRLWWMPAEYPSIYSSARNDRGKNVNERIALLDIDCNVSGRRETTATWATRFVIVIHSTSKVTECWADRLPCYQGRRPILKVKIMYVPPSTKRMLLYF